MVHAHLIPKGRPNLRVTTLAEVKHQILQWPEVKMTLGYDEQLHTFEVLKVEDLPFPVLLDHGTPSFSTLVRVAI